jgi:chaperonin cofactor prefoldin
MIKDFTNLNANDFTQKDLMLHLLQVSQHTVTREEVKEDISQIDKKLDKLDDKISNVETNLKLDISKLDDKISKVDSKFDKIQWLIIATLVTVLSKDYIFSLIETSTK